MKAIILSLADTQELWPVPTGGTPAGAPLLGRPLLAWTAQALKRAGADELILALPEGVQPPVQEVLPLSVRLLPAGTEAAEALLLCASELAGGDFLAVDGGLLWELDLNPALAAHRRSGLAATLVLPGPPAEPSGRVLPFPERPDAPQPPAETGIMVLSPSVFRFLSKREALLPQLRRTSELDTVHTAGYCRRVDDPASLLQAAADLLAGKCRLGLDGEQVQTGIWTRSPIPEGVELVPPCSIGANVTLGKGCLIGPHVCLEDGVSVGDHSLVQRSILQTGTAVGSRATVYGAVVCRDACLGNYTVLNEGAAIGPGAEIGDNVILMEGVGVGAGLTVPASVRLTRSLTAALERKAPRPEPELTVEDMLCLGRRLGRCGAVGAGGAGFRGLLLARAFSCGAAAQGADVVFHDGVLPEQAAWLARYYRWPASVFADESGGVYLYDQAGRPLTAPPADGETGEGSWDLLAGTGAAYAAAQARDAEEALPPACTAFHHKRGLELF